MGMPKEAAEGRYVCGRGCVYVMRQNPKEYVLRWDADRKFVDIVKQAYETEAKAGPLQWKNVFTLSRGNYDLIAVLDENAVDSAAYTAKGMLIDLFDPQLPVLSSKTVQPGQQAFLFNVSRLENKKQPQVLASAARIYDEKHTHRSYSFTAKSPLNTTNVMRVRLPKRPKSVKITKGASQNSSRWDQRSRTLWLSFENHPDGVEVTLNW